MIPAPVFSNNRNCKRGLEHTKGDHGGFMVNVAYPSVPGNCNSLNWRLPLASKVSIVYMSLTSTAFALSLNALRTSIQSGQNK